MESLRFVLQSVKKVSDNIGGLCALSKNRKARPRKGGFHSLESCIPLSFLLLFSLDFLLLREAKLRRNGGKPCGFTTDIDGAFVAGFGKGVFF